ncbi:MAG: ATPase, T2SS/T4P/T4SS family [Planctomycetota bacterium]|nr:ATPase, T2SS/T4P/T4SS family [Planctomycetota bacterium]
METSYLEIVTPEGSHRRELGAKPLTIGRHSDNLVVITDEQASRYHCVVEKAGNSYRVRDLKSKNGTRVNDAKIDAVVLRPGDTISVGKTRMRFVTPASKSAPPPPSGGGGGGDDVGPSSIDELAELSGGDDEPAEEPAKKPARPMSGLAGKLFGRGTPKRGQDVTVPAPSSSSSSKKEKSHDSAPDIFANTSGDDDSPVVHEDEEEPVAEEPQDERTRSIRALESLAEAGTDKTIGETDIKLVNARGDILNATARAGEEESPEEEEGPAPDGIRILRLLFLACQRARATDLHVEPKAEDYVVRLRVDGAMVEAAHLDKKSANMMTGVVKVLCDIDVGIRQNIIQEGHFSVRLPDRRVDYRVSFTPSMYGQKLVVRVLDLANAPKYMTDLAMPDWMLQSVRRVSKQDAGMILVAGPTGSGKTTTLYTVLRDIDVQSRNVVTIEDPVEYQIAGVTQIPIDEFKGNTFSTLLRSVLRQDPDVILLGEIRDKETAMTAMQAAMTGHLVFSTVHAKDTVGTIFRLLDLGVEPYLVASALNIVVAQRLIRMLCPYCKEEKKPTPQQTIRMGKAVEGLSKIWVPVGCPKCLNTGFAGRMGVYEMMQVTDDMRDVILKSPTINAIREAIKMTVFVSLQQAGYKLAAEGITSMDEVERVTGTE